MKKIVRWVAEKLFSFPGLLLFSKIIFPVKEVKREKDIPPNLDKCMARGRLRP